MERLIKPIEEVRSNLKDIIEPLETVRNPPLLQTTNELVEIIRYVNRKVKDYFQNAIEGEGRGFSVKEIAWKIGPPIAIDPNKGNQPPSKSLIGDFKWWCSSFDENLEAFLLLLEHSDYLTGKISEPIRNYTEIEAKNLILTKLFKLHSSTHYLVEVLLLSNGFIPRYPNYDEELAVSLERKNLVNKYQGAGRAKVKLSIDGRMYVEEILEKAKRLELVRIDVRGELGKSKLEFADNLKKLLAEDQIEKVFEALRVMVIGDDLKDSLVMIYGTLSVHNKDKDKGIITHREYVSKRNQVRQALLNFLNHLSDKELEI